jgi:hypothetical protein
VGDRGTVDLGADPRRREMVRLAGVPLLSAVVIGADRTDESVSLTYPPQAPTGPDLGIIGS